MITFKPIQIKAHKLKLFKYHKTSKKKELPFRSCSVKSNKAHKHQRPDEIDNPKLP